MFKYNCFCEYIEEDFKCQVNWPIFTNSNKLFNFTKVGKKKKKKKKKQSKTWIMILTVPYFLEFFHLFCCLKQRVEISQQIQGTWHYFDWRLWFLFYSFFLSFFFFFRTRFGFSNTFHIYIMYWNEPTFSRAIWGLGLKFWGHLAQGACL